MQEDSSSICSRAIITLIHHYPGCGRHAGISFVFVVLTFIGQPLQSWFLQRPCFVLHVLPDIGETQIFFYEFRQGPQDTMSR